MPLVIHHPPNRRLSVIVRWGPMIPDRVPGLTPKGNLKEQEEEEQWTGCSLTYLNIDLQ